MDQPSLSRRADHVPRLGRHVDYGEITRMIGHITVATMDRCCCPRCSTELDRITYVDIDTVDRGRRVRAGGTDLGGYPLAARTSVSAPCAEQWRRPATCSTGRDGVRAAAHDGRAPRVRLHHLQRRRAGARPGPDARRPVRRRRYLPLAGRGSGSTTRTSSTPTSARTGPSSIEKWNALPMFEDVTEPGIIHYAGAQQAMGRRARPVPGPLATVCGPGGRQGGRAALIDTDRFRLTAPVPWAG